MSESAANAKATPAVAFCFLANGLLARETWARERLGPFAGQGFEVHLPLLAPLSLVIGESGRIEEGDAPSAAVVTLGGITGDSALADELRYLRKNLRPDVEEELSRFVGDVTAHRLVGTARSFLQWQLEAFSRVAQAAVDYAVEERRALVRRPELADLGNRIAELDRALAQLEQRMRRL